MHAKWKNNKYFNPSVILKKLDSIKALNPEGKITFDFIEYYEILAVLENMIHFSDAAKILNQDYVLRQAIADTVKHGTLEQDQLIKATNSVIKKELARKDQTFYLLTNISLNVAYIPKIYSIEDCSIRILNSNFPSKYNSRSNLLEKITRKTAYIEEQYFNCVLKAKSRTERGAADKAIRALDLQRSIWNFFGNSTTEIWSNEWTPINKIRLGPTHTLHNENGKTINNIYWFEPNFTQASLYTPDNPKIYNKNCKWAMEQLFKLPYGEKLKEALLRYVRALDERDQNVAFIRLWGALESVCASGENNNDLVIRRCSFLYQEHSYHKQVLEHLRDYRNSNVHAGSYTEQAKVHCYLLQRYFYNIMIFYLKNKFNFKSLEEANAFLDLPPDITTLEKKKGLMESAIIFRT